MSDFSLPIVLHFRASKKYNNDMANINKKSKKAPSFGEIIYSTPIPRYFYPPKPHIPTAKESG